MIARSFNGQGVPTIAFDDKSRFPSVLSQSALFYVLAHTQAHVNKVNGMLRMQMPSTSGGVYSLICSLTCAHVRTKKTIYFNSHPLLVASLFVKRRHRGRLKTGHRRVSGEFGPFACPFARSLAPLTIFLRSSLETVCFFMSQTQAVLNHSGLFLVASDKAAKSTNDSLACGGRK